MQQVWAPQWQHLQYIACDNNTEETKCNRFGLCHSTNTRAVLRKPNTTSLGSVTVPTPILRKRIVASLGSITWQYIACDSNTEETKPNKFDLCRSANTWQYIACCRNTEGTKSNKFGLCHSGNIWQYIACCRNTEETKPNKWQHLAIHCLQQQP